MNPSGYPAKWRLHFWTTKSSDMIAATQIVAMTYIAIRKTFDGKMVD